MGRAIGGTIQGWNGQDVRVVDDFYKGGETIRGFATAGLGPRDQNTGDSLGGKTFYAGTTEVRFPLPFIPEDLGFGGAIFADAGSVYGTDAQKFANTYCSKPANVAGCLASPPGAVDRLRRYPSICWREPVMELSGWPAACRLCLRPYQAGIRPNSVLPVRCSDKILAA